MIKIIKCSFKNKNNDKSYISTLCNYYIFFFVGVFSILNANDDFAIWFLSSSHFSSQFEFQSLFRQYPLERFGHFAIDANSTN